MIGSSRTAWIAGLLCGLTITPALMAGEIGSMNRVTVIPVPNGGEAADARITADGTIHLLYNSGDIPYYVKSTDNGATFSAPIPVVENAARKPDLVFGASAMAVGKGGAVYVAMMTNNWKTKLAGVYCEETNDQRDMYLVIMGKDGHEKRTLVSETLWKVNACPMTYYSISAAKDGYVAAWPTKGEIYFARLDKAGNRLPPGEIKTPGRSGMRTGLTALAAPDGKSLVAWKNLGVLGWQIYDEQGRPESAPGSVKSAGKGTAGVVDRNGRFILFQ